MVIICGIVGVASKNNFSSSDILKSLKRLEYRGYDSFGLATNIGLLEKDVGEIRALANNECNVAIAHTRWATHGGVTKENAHPHADCTNSLFIVHNGIIENYHEFKTALEKLGHKFRSQTDSEVIAHFFEEELKNKPIEKAISDFFHTAKGTFAILLIRKGNDKIYALKRDSPLVLGILSGGLILASDIYAFSEKTNKAIFFEDNEFAIIDHGKYQFYDAAGKMVDKEIKQFQWSEHAKEIGNFEHYMIKEIHEEPEAVNRLVTSLKTTQKEKLTKMKSMIENAKKIMFVASGTSYHASLLGVYFFHKIGINAQALIASEFKNFMLPDKNTLVIAITQSGETMDVIEALKIAKQQGATIASFVNVPHSTIQRMSDLYIEILAGQEICVAATKSFVNQVVLLLKIASLLGYEDGLENISDEIMHILRAEELIKDLTKELKDHRDVYLIGRGLSYPVAREIALKLKEISYIHAEGMMGGELKHGTLALIEECTPVIALIPKNGTEIISNAKEVEARGGRVIAITNAQSEFENITVKTEHEGNFAILATVIGQLLTYYIAKERELPIDKPRNLAKSCTVL